MQLKTGSWHCILVSVIFILFKIYFFQRNRISIRLTSWSFPSSFYPSFVVIVIFPMTNAKLLYSISTIKVELVRHYFILWWLMLMEGEKTAEKKERKNFFLSCYCFYLTCFSGHKIWNCFFPSLCIVTDSFNFLHYLTAVTLRRIL